MHQKASREALTYLLIEYGTEPQKRSTYKKTLENLKGWIVDIYILMALGYIAPIEHNNETHYVITQKGINYASSND
jgi:hypothetical protein